MLEPEQILRDIQAGNYSPIYFLQGEEPYYIDLITNFIEKFALPESAKSFNQVVMYGKDVTMADVINNAKRFPMMSDRQVVIVKEAQNISDFGKENANKILEAYIQHPLPSTILVFGYKYKTLDRRKSLAKVIEKQAILVNSAKIYDNKVPGWIKNYIETKGFKITEKAIIMLAENIGNNLERLANEIDKMLINFKVPVEIDDHMIQKYIGISKEYNAFELQRAIMFKDVVKANKIINYFEANPKNNPIIPIIAIIFNFFTKVLIIHHHRNYTEPGVVSLLKINRFFVKEYIVAAQNYPIHKVLANIHFLKTADLQSKGVNNNSVTDGQILKELIFKLMH